jgi:glycosyltransferase involved in cell wall biosynthesis
MRPLSVVICSHNSRVDYLQRVLNALCTQTLPKDQWELLIVDNASERLLAKEWDLSWHPLARHVREDELGLTPARLRGIAEAAGELLVFVDDDNVLEQDYLETALTIAQAHPFLGAWGGTIRGEFEIEPEERARPLLGYLALREFSGPLWTNNPGDALAHPSGAGLCVRSSVAKEYAKQVTADPRRRKLGRIGELLSSGEDYDLIETTCDLGMGFGNFPALTMTHLIPRDRLQFNYLVRLMQGCTGSGVILRYLRAGIVPPEPNRLRVTARFLFKYPAEGRHQARIFKAERDAVRRGIQSVRELPPRSTPALSADAAPCISVVIPSYQRRTRLLECLERLARCEGAKDVEVIVVEQLTSAPELAAGTQFASSFSRFEHIKLATPNVSAARNSGALRASGEVLLFVDDDIELDRTYLRNLLALFKKQQVHVVAGEYVQNFSALVAEKFKEVEWLPTGNIALRREDFFAVGGFDENLYRYNEDAELSHRLILAGLKFATHGSLRAIHHNEALGGTHSQTSIFERTRAGMRNDLYFWYAVRGRLGTVLYEGLRILWGAALGNWKVKDRPILFRLAVCCASVPDALLYTFRSPRLLSPDQLRTLDR